MLYVDLSMRLTAQTICSNEYIYTLCVCVGFLFKLNAEAAISSYLILQNNYVIEQFFRVDGIASTGILLELRID